MAGTSRAGTIEIAPGVVGHTLENDLVRVTVLPAQGASIYALEDLETGIDVLYKAPWGARNHGDIPLTTNSMVSWFDRYPGGWPVLFPSGNLSSIHRGVEHGYHGEASSVPWSCRAIAADGSATLHLEVSLAHSPFHIEREMRLEAGERRIKVREIATNVGGQPFEYTWTHHPTFGAPFLSGACRIDTAARRVTADAGYNAPYVPIAPGVVFDWPMVRSREGKEVDLSRVPADGEPRQLLAYLGEFDSGWYAITNTELGLGFALSWPVSLMPHAWFFQELRASLDYPWYGRSYLMAIEPSTIAPALGLGDAVAAGLHRSLEPGESASLELNAVLYSSSRGVRSVSEDGTIELLD